jgi:murein DD-endopeptidase MepM/ murein hydrolase activator NlpD
MAPAGKTPNPHHTSDSQAHIATQQPAQEHSAGGLPEAGKRRPNRLELVVSVGMWLIAFSLVFAAGYLAWQTRMITAVAAIQDSTVSTQALVVEPTLSPQNVEMPGYTPGAPEGSVYRQRNLRTIIPTRPREDAIEYTVEQGDSVFGIAQKFNLAPETILWANFDLLEDRPDSLSVGMELNIPPIDGVYYKWREGDTIPGIAAALEVEADDILNWPGNNLDLTNPEVDVGAYIMAPGGKREFRSWIVPQIARGRAGVSPSVYGAGACQGSYEGAYGTGGFIWPTANRFLSGNDFWSGHLGIDIAGGVGDSVLAADSGVVVFSGWATGGYGYMIMIDHGNGYQTVYAHLNSVSTRCGQSIYQGNYIGGVGSTGNSTGAHLHFEVRLWGQFVNPWHVLP